MLQVPGPTYYMVSWAHQSPHSKQHIDWFSPLTQLMAVTNKHTDHNTSVITDHIYALHSLCITHTPFSRPFSLCINRYHIRILRN